MSMDVCILVILSDPIVSGNKHGELIIRAADTTLAFLTGVRNIRAQSSANPSMYPKSRFSITL